MARAPNISDAPASPKITYPLVEATLARYRTDAEAALPADPEAMDRRIVLRRLCRELGTDEAELLRWGFDRAYRQMVEGV